jgi:hypothetical protein
MSHSISYNNVNHTRMCHDSYLPSSRDTLQTLDRMEYVMVNAVTPPDVRIVSPHFIVSPHSPSDPETSKCSPGIPDTLGVHPEDVCKDGVLQ